MSDNTQFVVLNNTTRKARRRKGVATERERGERRERVHLLPCILVTAPVSHLDTSELNASALINTARREGCNKEKKENKPTQNVPFQKTNKKKM